MSVNLFIVNIKKIITHLAVILRNKNTILIDTNINFVSQNARKKCGLTSLHVSYKQACKNSRLLSNE